MKTKSLEKSLVSIIIRSCNLKRYSLLLQAVESIKNNKYQPIEVIIVAQTTSQLFIDKVEELVKIYSSDELSISTIINYTSKDQRAKNLNLGIANARGRFLGFLDDDDIFYPDHLETLVTALENTDRSHGWAYTDVAIVLYSTKEDGLLNIISTKYPFKRDGFSHSEFLKNNFIPLHSYLIDRLKINNDSLKFDETFAVTEDYAFLLNLVKDHNPIYIPKVTCEYRFWDDCSNTNYHVNILIGSDYRKKIGIWQEAAERLEILKLLIDPYYQPSSLVSIETRHKFMSRFPSIYKLKFKYPKIWDWLVRTTVFLKLIK